MKSHTQNLLLMAVSVGLAVLLWFLVSEEERSEIILSTPLEYRGLPKGFEILSDGGLLTTVNVWVRGTTATIKNLQPHEVRAWVDLAGAGPGDRILELSSANVQVPYDFAVLRISPSQIRLRIEQIVTRRVPVMPQLEGKPPDGYALVGTFVTPPEVEIVGPKSAVDAIKRVITDSIDLSTIKSEFSSKVNAGVENSAVRLGKTKEVVVSLRVSEIKDILTLRRVALSIEGSKGIVRFTPKVVRVELQAAKPLLKQVVPAELRAVLDLKGLKAGVYELTPRIEGLNNKSISVITVDPVRVHVEIE
jgi:YbbR domain-containing protein